MESVQVAAMRAAARKWIDGQHLRNVLKGDLSEMYDSDGKPLKGIRGRMGAVGMKVDGTDIGVDCIEMQPGSAFALHEHVGDHVLLFLSGVGSVHISGEDRVVGPGDTMFIPGEHPHAVTGPPETAREPLVIIAFGHPHKDVNAPDRMKHPSDHSHDHGHGHHHGHKHEH